MRKLEWRIDDRPVEYPKAVAEMEARVAAIRAGRGPRNWSGCSSTRRSIPPAPARKTPICWSRTAFRSTAAAAAASSPTTGPASELPT